MSKINPQQDEIRDYQKQVNEIRQKHQIEVQKIKNNNELQRLKMRDDHQVQLENIRTENDMRIAEDVVRRDKVLTQIKDSINKSNEMAKNQIEQNKLLNDTQLSNQNINFKNRFENVSNQNEDNILEATKLHSDKIKELHFDSQKETQQMSQAHHLSKTNLAKINDNQMKGLKEQQEIRYTQEKKKNELSLENQRVDFNKELNQLKTKNYRQTTDAEQQHKKQMEIQLEQNQAKLEQESNNFKNKYSNLISQNDEVVENLNSKTTELLADIQKRFAHDVDLSLSKLTDDFYHTRKIVPVVEDNPDHYLVSIPLPSYESKNIQFSGKDRKIKITLNRDMNQEIQESENVNSKIKKVETQIIEVDVDQIIDAKKIEQTFKNNKVFFKVAKK